MGFTTAGLTNDGHTPHYSITYDDTFSLADGQNRANALLANCEQDFALMAGWFGGIDLKYAYPINVQIVNASGGGSWNSDGGIFGKPTVTVKLQTGSVDTSLTTTRYLLVSEVTEMFMATQDNGWFEDSGLFHGADEGSKGEGLSLFLGVQFQLANGLGSVPPSGYAVTSKWLNSGRPDFVNNNPDDLGKDPTNGCTTLFLYYLHDQLNKSINGIIAAGSSNLAGVYHNLTGLSDAWTAFSNIVNSHYPPGFTYHPIGDTVFPVPELVTFYAPNQITTGYSTVTEIFIDRPALTEINIRLTSDDPSLVSVAPFVTIAPGAMSISVGIDTAALSEPLMPIVVNVHADYAGKRLTVPVEIVPPRIASVTLSPDSVVCGDSTTVTVTLNRASLLGDVIVELSGHPYFAPIPDSLGGEGGHLTIPQDNLSATFVIVTPDHPLPFKTAHAEIMAVYMKGTIAESYASATLTVKSRIVAGIIESLTLFPATVTGGHVTHGTVTLIEAVPTDTLVGLAAVEPDAGHLPLPGHDSSIAHVPSSLTIPAGETTGRFTISTSPVLPGTTRSATIMAGAVDTKYAHLTVTS